MRYRYQKARRRGVDPMIAMINIVFLLIVFFLFGQFQERQPFAVLLPVVEAQESAQISDRLFVSETGEFAYKDLRGNAAITAIQELKHPYLIAVDQNLPAHEMIAILSRIKGANEVHFDIEVSK